MLAGTPSTLRVAATMASNCAGAVSRSDRRRAARLRPKGSAGAVGPHGAPRQREVDPASGRAHRDRPVDRRLAAAEGRAEPYLGCRLSLPGQRERTTAVPDRALEVPVADPGREEPQRV